MVRGGSPVFTATSVRAVPSSPVRFKRSTGREPRPPSPVDLDLYQSTCTRPLHRKEPSRLRSYTWFVPDMLSPNSRIHATFKDAGGIVLGQADTRIFRILARKPAIGDFDGDGTSDLTIYRPSDAMVHQTLYAKRFQLCRRQLLPMGIVHGHSSEGRLRRRRHLRSRDLSTLGRRVVRPLFLDGLQHQRLGLLPVGLSSDIPIPADFDGDGRTDLAIYRPSDGGWYIRYSVAWLLLHAVGVLPMGPVHRPAARGRFRRRWPDRPVGLPSLGRWLVYPLLVAWLHHEPVGVLPVGPEHRQAAGGRLRRRRQDRPGALPSIRRRLVHPLLVAWLLLHPVGVFPVGHGERQAGHRRLRRRRQGRHRDLPVPPMAGGTSASRRLATPPTSGRTYQWGLSTDVLLRP